MNPRIIETGTGGPGLSGTDRDASIRYFRPRVAARIIVTGKSLGDAGLFLLVAAAGSLVAVSSVRSPLLTMAGISALALLVLAIRSLAVAVAVFTVVTFFEQMPGFGQSVSFVKLATVGLVISWIGLLTARRWKPVLVRDHPLLTHVALMLVAWAGASTLWAADSSTAAAGAFRLAQMVFLLFLVFTAISEPRHLRYLGWGFIAGAVLTGVVGFAKHGFDTGQFSAARFGGDFGNPNNLAAVILPALALAAFMGFSSRRMSERWLLAACGAFLVFTLFLTQSRGGLIGFGVMCVAAIVFGGPARPRAAALAIVIAGVALLYFAILAPSSVRDRVTSISFAESTGRADLWTVAYEAAQDHPVQGVGIDNFVVVAPRYLERNVGIEHADVLLRGQTGVHNTYLNALTELGIIGLLIFLALLASIFGVAVRAVHALARARDVESELLARGLIAGVAGMLTAYFFFTAQFEKQLWLVLGALIAVSTLARAAYLRATQGREGESTSG
jgi:O-antigen ligase